MLQYVHLLLFVVGAFPPLFKHIFFSAIWFSRTFSFKIRFTIYLELGFVFSGTQWDSGYFLYMDFILSQPQLIKRLSTSPLTPLSSWRHSHEHADLKHTQKQLSKTPSFHLHILAQVLLQHESRSPKPEETLCSPFCRFTQRCSFPWLVSLDDRTWGNDF